MSERKRPEEGDHEDFLALFRKGLKFTEEILEENEKLRFRVASLQSDVESRGGGVGAGDDVVSELKLRIARLEEEKTRLQDRYREVENLNRDYQARYADIEEEHNNLANLYIASYQLHSTMAFPEVVQVISEIVINLVGVARFTMMLLDAPSKTLHAIASEDRDLRTVEPVVVGQGLIGGAADKRQRFVHEAGAPAGDGPLAVVPLATAENLVGVIVIEKLLVQKPTFTPVDFELFNLLGVHAATALLSGLLRDQVGGSGESALTIEHARRLLSRS